MREQGALREIREPELYASLACGGRDWPGGRGLGELPPPGTNVPSCTCRPFQPPSTRRWPTPISCGAGSANEANTRALVIEPVLAALGWDPSDLSLVDREYCVYDGTFLDYALRLDGNAATVFGGEGHRQVVG